MSFWTSLFSAQSGATFVSAFIAVTVHHFTKGKIDQLLSRAKRREEQAQHDFDHLLSVIDRIRADGISYWSVEPGENRVAVMVGIRSDLLFVTKALPPLFKDKEKVLQACQLRLNRLDAQVTGGDFAGVDPPVDTGRATEVGLAAAELSAFIRTNRRSM